MTQAFLDFLFANHEEAKDMQRDLAELADAFERVGNSAMSAEIYNIGLSIEAKAAETINKYMAELNKPIA